MVSCAVDVVQVNIIKKFSPDYKTWAEIAKEKGEERQKITEEETKILKEKQKIELGLEIKEDLIEQKMIDFAKPRKIETVLRDKGYTFEIGYYIYAGSYMCVIDNNIWVCGDLIFKDEEKQKYYSPTLIFSDNSGEDYRILKTFEELNSRYASYSPLLFLEKEVGYLAICPKIGLSSSVYKTNDGGLNWNKILTINNVPINNFSNVKRIRVVNQNIYLIISFEGGENHNLLGLDHDFIESNDGGKTWVYQRNYKAVAKTSNIGATWELVDESL
jgi:hypothetical protein